MQACTKCTEALRAQPLRQQGLAVLKGVTKCYCKHQHMKGLYVGMWHRFGAVDLTSCPNCRAAAVGASPAADAVAKNLEGQKCQGNDEGLLMVF